ncbi:MAG: long-chain acyl-CoA synthetase, partial [Nocardioidaceae bacterium]|nr:long-chain acyl-CoA synthetase [Nocardioidaceae bacterium]
RTLARSDDLTTGNLLERFAAVRGSRPLASEPDGFAVTYAEAADLVARSSGTLRGRIEAGERVLVATPNGYRLFLACLAVGRAGGVAVPVNPKMADDEIEFVEADSGATTRVDDFDELVGAAPTAAVDVDPKSVAVLFYTSGTTGRPKGAELTHRALVGRAGAGAFAPERLLQRGCVTGMPVAHIAGFTALVQLVSMGVPVYLLPRFRPTDALDAIESRKPLMFIGVPMMYRMMLEAGAEQRDLSSVRLWSSGADALPDELAHTFQRLGAAARLPGTNRTIGKSTFIDGYGMVELGGGAAIRIHAPVKLPVVGGGLKPMFGNTFRILDDAGDEVPRGEVGELAVKGPGVMRGYHGRDGATSEALTADGWLRTGDLAKARPLGYVELAGRKKDVIKVGGYSVFAVEVERALEEHPAVAEAAVLGLPDDRKGEIVVAAVRLVPDASPSPEELVAFGREKLSDYKVPTRIVIVDELPRTGTDKVQKRNLLPLFAES